MKCELSAQAYRWHDGTQWHVGKMVVGEWEDGNQIAVTNNGRGYVSHLHKDDLVLMAHSYTRELEFVAKDKLEMHGPPGGDKMPEPSK